MSNGIGMAAMREEIFGSFEERAAFVRGLKPQVDKLLNEFHKENKERSAEIDKLIKKENKERVAAVEKLLKTESGKRIAAATAMMADFRKEHASQFEELLSRLAQQEAARRAAEEERLKAAQAELNARLAEIRARIDEVSKLFAEFHKEDRWAKAVAEIRELLARFRKENQETAAEWQKLTKAIADARRRPHRGAMPKTAEKKPEVTKAAEQETEEKPEKEAAAPVKAASSQKRKRQAKRG